MTDKYALKKGAEGNKGASGQTEIDRIGEAMRRLGFGLRNTADVMFALEVLCANDLPAGLELVVEVRRGDDE